MTTALRPINMNRDYTARIQFTVVLMASDSNKCLAERTFVVGTEKKNLSGATERIVCLISNESEEVLVKTVVSDFCLPQKVIQLTVPYGSDLSKLYFTVAGFCHKQPGFENRQNQSTFSYYRSVKEAFVLQ